MYSCCSCSCSCSSRIFPPVNISGTVCLIRLCKVSNERSWQARFSHAKIIGIICLPGGENWYQKNYLTVFLRFLYLNPNISITICLIWLCKVPIIWKLPFLTELISVMSTLLSFSKNWTKLSNNFFGSNFHHQRGIWPQSDGHCWIRLAKLLLLTPCKVWSDIRFWRY